MKPIQFILPNEIFDNMQFTVEHFANKNSESGTFQCNDWIPM